MPNGISRKRLGLSLLVLSSIVGFGLLLVSRFNATDITPASNAVQGSAVANQADLLEATDKPELAQTDVIAANPSEKVRSAEQAMPSRSQPEYQTACQNMKQMYVSEHKAKLQSEASRFSGAQQNIINKYDLEGKSFSTHQKSARSAEAARHEGIVKQINEQYQQQLKNLGC